MQIGKLPNDVLEESIISKIKRYSKDVLVGPQVGEDCAVVKFNDDVCVLTTDPITAAGKNAGKIGVHICCNDIASAGVRPLGILVTILASPSNTKEDVKEVMNDVVKVCDELSIDILGGHTEITDAVNRMVLSITAIGKGKKDEYVTTRGAKAGDDIVVTGNAGLEGTTIIARDYYNTLKDIIGEDILNRAKNMLKDISVVKAGLIASEFGVNAMHDATEGGILGAVWEIAKASDKGLYIDKKNIPIKEETLKICTLLDINPYRLISSGCMVIACSKGDELCGILNENGIEAKVIGKITDGGKIIKTSKGEEEILPPESDEIYKAGERASLI